MKRFHVHVGVENLDQSIGFYTGLFGVPPTVRKTDYAKWMVDDPRLNFAISQRNGRIGVNHLGLEADSADELGDIRERFAAANAAGLLDEPGATCCYAKSDKHWVTDPQRIAWEAYHSLGEVRYFDGDAAPAAASSCCAPADGDRAANRATASASETRPAAQASCCAPATASTVGAKVCCAAVDA
jgi:catechol 2,3-dioxygenase-like lactoylglutathione lyase family enzyme